MRSCVICHFDAELDDQVTAVRAGGCICLTCYLRETGDARRMPKRLARELSAIAV